MKNICVKVTAADIGYRQEGRTSVTLFLEPLDQPGRRLLICGDNILQGVAKRDFHSQLVILLNPNQVSKCAADTLGKQLVAAGFLHNPAYRLNITFAVTLQVLKRPAAVFTVMQFLLASGNLPGKAGYPVLFGSQPIARILCLGCKFSQLLANRA